MCASLLAAVLWSTAWQDAAAVGSSGSSGLRVRRLAGMNMDLHIKGSPGDTPAKKAVDLYAYSGNQIFLQIGSTTEEESVDANTSVVDKAEALTDGDDDMAFSHSAHSTNHSEILAEVAAEKTVDIAEESANVHTKNMVTDADDDMVFSDSAHSANHSEILAEVAAEKTLEIAEDSATVNAKNMVTEADDHMVFSDAAHSANHSELTAGDAAEKAAETAEASASINANDMAGVQKNDNAAVAPSPRKSLMRSERVTNVDKRQRMGSGTDGFAKAAAFQANIAGDGDKDDRELVLCLGSIVVLLCMFACITRLATFFRCASARHAITRDQLQQVACITLVDDSKKSDPVDESEMTTTLKSASDSAGDELRSASLPSELSGGLVEGLRTSSSDVVASNLQHNSLREQVSSISLEALSDVLEKLLAAGVHAGGFDCAIARPLSSHQVLRVEAEVLACVHGPTLTPLTLQPCVLYQATVCRRLHAGVPSVPVAFASMNTSFRVALCDHPDAIVAVEGEDVMLFDMCNGQFSHTGLFAEAPELLQDFVLTHRSAVPGGQWQTSSSLRSEAACLEFQQCALLTGSKVTLVGELVRDVGGSLAMRPTNLDAQSRAARVLVSDDPALCFK